MNRTAGPEGAKVDEFTTGLRPGVPAPANKPYGLLFSGILIFNVILENVDGFARLKIRQKGKHFLETKKTNILL